MRHGDVAFERCTVTGKHGERQTQRGLYIMNAIGCTVAANVAAEKRLRWDAVWDNCLHSAISSNLSAGNGSAAASTYYGIPAWLHPATTWCGNVIRHSTRHSSANRYGWQRHDDHFPEFGDVSALNDWRNGLEIEITSGTGSGQTARFPGLRWLTRWRR